MDVANFRVSEDDIQDLYEVLVEVAADWELFLGSIGVVGRVREEIKLKYPNSAKLCFLHGLEYWVASNVFPTYKKIIAGLSGKVVNNPVLAVKVEEFVRQKTMAPVPSVVVERTTPPQCEATSSTTEPETVALMRTFPALPAGEKTLHEVNVLDGRLSDESEQLHMQFGDLVVAVRNSLKDRVEVRELVSTLSEYSFSQQREGISRDYESALRITMSLYDIFDVIRPYYSFFHYRVIELLVKRFGTNEDKERLAEYEKQFKKFCRNRVYKCPADHFGMEGKFEICLVAKLMDEFKKFTLNAVNKFRTKLCSILSVPDDALRFIGAAEGCVELRFAMFSSLERVIFPLSDQQQERLREEGVMELRGGTHQYLLAQAGGSFGQHGHSELGSDQSQLESALCEAAQSGLTDRVAELLDSGVDVNTRDQTGMSPLMLAARCGHTDSLRALLSSGADMFLREGENGWTALYLAAANGHTATLEVLVAAGAGKDIQTKEGETPLIRAALNGHTSTVELLVAAGAAMNIQDKNGWTALYWAARSGHTAVVEVLATAGADLNIRSNDGVTALMHGAVCGHTAAVEVLVAARADINIGSKNGVTALMWAALYGHTATLQFLIAAGADMDIQHTSGVTALIYALREESSSEAAEVLIKAGAGLSYQETATNWNALFFAAKRGDLHLVRLLLERGADPTLTDKEGVTAFDVASVYNHDSVMKELEKYALGSDVASDVTLPAASTAAAEPPFTETQHTMSSQSRQTVQKRTVRDRVLRAVRILADRLGGLVLAGRARKREERREGADKGKPGQGKKSQEKTAKR